MSKFLFHLKFSQKENYVHEHELYEVMRSRNLYQVQFEVRSNFKKRMRNIQISQKAHVNGFQNSRNIFIQKMKERMEQADMLRTKTSMLAQKSFARIDANDNKKVRRYVTLPPTPTARPEFPNLVQKMATPVEQPVSEISPSTIMSGMRSRRGTGTTRRSSSMSTQSSSFLANAPSPSMAATMYVDNTPMARLEKEREKNRNKAFLTSKVVVAGKRDTTTHFIKKQESGGDNILQDGSSNSSPYTDDTGSTRDDNFNDNTKEPRLELPIILESGHEPNELTETIKEHSKFKGCEELQETDNITKYSDSLFKQSDIPIKKESVPTKQKPFSTLTNSHVEDADRNDKHLNSFVHFPDNLATTENLDSDTASQKVVEWATAHKLLSKSVKEIEEEKTFRRLLIDRPSKWAFSHIHGNAMNDSGVLDLKFHAPHSQTFDIDRGKSRPLDKLSERLNSKPKVTLSLPAIETVKRKPLVSMEPGGLTPDGRLILTQGDYEEYLSGYRRARNMRLNLTKKKNKTLSKMVDNFRISSKLQLKDDTGILAVQSEC